VEAVLIGVDSSNGKVWLSMRQVLPDPLQETLDALLAEGPSSANSPAANTGDPSAAGISRDPTSFHDDDTMV